VSEDLDPTKLAAVAQVAQDAYDDSPPDIEQWTQALEGFGKLWQFAIDHLQADPPNFAEAARCIAVAIRGGGNLHQQISLAYVLSGQATDEFMETLQRQFSDFSRDLSRD